MSDNCRSRFGRRRPYIFWEGLLMALVLGIAYMASPFWGTWTLFGYAVVTCILFYLMYTIFQVPYAALGLELTDDYDERANIQKFRMIFASVATFTIPCLCGQSCLFTHPGVLADGALSAPVSFDRCSAMGSALRKSEADPAKPFEGVASGIESGRHELFDLKDDPEELHDCALDYPERTERLSRMLEQHPLCNGVALDDFAADYRLPNGNFPEDTLDEGFCGRPIDVIRHRPE